MTKTMTPEQLNRAYSNAQGRLSHAAEALLLCPWWRLIKRWHLRREYADASFQCQSLEMYARD